MKTIVRVAVTNNFNCSTNEWEQLSVFSEKHQDKYFFINSNIHTPGLQSIKDHNFKAVITANPDLYPSDISLILSRLKEIQNQVAFVRVKYLPNNEPIMALIKDLLVKGFKIVLTLQRFNSKTSLTKFTSLEYYKHSCSRYRLAGSELDRIRNQVTSWRQNSGYPVWICDQSGTGCQGCGLCSTLTSGEQDTKISSLNLSSSGICPYNCPDCYAKTMQNFARKMNHRPIIFDTIRQNDKQAGRTSHIKEKRTP